jgi:dinuclear metal center YbgI/SA1388 family protein
LQIKAKKEIKKIGFAVDAVLSTFQKAKHEKIDLLIVHHGIKWKKQKNNINKIRENFLKKNKIALYAVHLPLDLNSKYGNNIELAKILNLKEVKKFGKYHGFKIGYKGEFKKTINLNNIAKILNKELKTKCKIFKFGKKQIKTIGIVSGGGSDAIEEAVKQKLDCFLTGEIPLHAYHIAKDYKISIIEAGHYATETLGVKALIQLIKEKFNIKVIFIDNPTGV